MRFLKILNSSRKIAEACRVTRNYTARAYIQQLGREPLIYRSLGDQLLRSVDKFGPSTALVSVQEQSHLTFEEAYNEAATLTLRLQQLGLQRGAHLGIWAPNTRHWYVTCLAAALGGYTLVCLNPAWQAAELSYALNKAKVRVLITQDAYGKLDFNAVLQQLSGSYGATLEYIVMRGLPQTNDKQFLDYDTLLQPSAIPQDVNKLFESVKEISPEAPCNIQFTSGTTGQPKAALLTSFGLINTCHQLGRTLNLHELKRICVAVPFFHVFGLAVLVAALKYGGTLVVPSATFSAKHALESIESTQCQVLVGTPTMFVDMVQQQERLQKSVGSLNTALVGGAACSPQVYSAVKRTFNLQHMRIGYGMSEVSAAVMATDNSKPEDQEMQSVGKLFEHCEAKVINESGETVPFGVTGELCLRGYCTMLGYYEDEENTAATLGTDGWLKTGDEFVLDKSGLARIVGRKKDIIIRGGENIYPKELENFLEAHPDVLEVQVVGVPDPRLGEDVCAYLRLKPTRNPLTTEDIAKYCKGHLAQFKVPRYVRIIEDFPKTASGKIQKFKLVEMFLNETSN